MTTTNGTFTGGEGAITVSTVFQVSDSSAGTNGWSWLANGSKAFLLTTDQEGKYIRSSSTGTDSIGQTAPANSSPVGPVAGYDPLAMGDPVVTGEAVVGKTLTCLEPSVSGGSGEHDFDYAWRAGSSEAIVFAKGNSIVVPESVIGRTGYCTVTVNDVIADQSVTKNSNEVGPVVAAPSIGDITATVMGTPYDLAAGMAFSCSIQTEFPISVQISGDAPATYNWSVRGDKTVLFSDPISASTDIAIVSEGVVTVQCVIQSLDESKSADIQFFAEDF